MTENIRPKSTTKKAAKKAAGAPGPRADEADGESAVLAKIAEMSEPDRAMGERLHAIIKASAQPSRRGSGTGCPRMPRTARSSASSKAREVQNEVRDVRLHAPGEPRRRRHVADRLRAEGVDRRRRGKDRRAREESGELRTE